jgi:prepilin-type N-terminal cleavage/methylation domain-containing protein
MKLNFQHTFKQTCRAMSIVELLVALSIGSVVLAMASTLWMFGARSFASMSNYADLDAKSRRAVDQMGRELREATRVVDFQNIGNTKWLKLTNSDQGITLKFTWDASSRKLVLEKTGVPNQTYLTECDGWDFQAYQRSPQKDTTNLFYPATNISGTIDPSICKLIDMTWKCSRTVLGSRLNTENVQTAQVVLRNKS